MGGGTWKEDSVEADVYFVTADGFGEEGDLGEALLHSLEHVPQFLPVLQYGDVQVALPGGGIVHPEVLLPPPLVVLEADEADGAEVEGLRQERAPRYGTPREMDVDHVTPDFPRRVLPTKAGPRFPTERAGEDLARGTWKCA